MEELKQYPLWKQAVEDFISGNPQPGDVITEEWKHRHFGITPPTYGSAVVWKDYQLKMLSAFDSFANTLTEDFQLHLRSDRRGGHVVLAPAEQTRTALDDCNAGIKRALRKSKFKLENVAVSALTTEERKEHTDAQVRLAMSATMFKKVKRLALT